MSATPLATLTTPTQPGTTGGAAPRGELALALQELFTVVVRLRAGRQLAADAGSFRAHVMQLLGAANQRAEAIGYDRATVKAAVYAYVALLDESILNSSQPMFSEWSRRPLQEELFGEHMAGENFFRAVHDLLERPDSETLADLLEVCELCLLLGFRGRYASGDPAALLTVTSAIHTKLQRIRGVTPLHLAPDAALPENETPPAARDAWTRRLAISAGVCVAFAGVLYIAYRLILGAAVGDLTAPGL